MEQNQTTASAFNRRQFLAASTLAGAGLVLAPRTLRAQNANVPSNRATGEAINIAVVGCGEQGNALLNSINGIRKEGQIPFRLIGLCDVWPYQLKANVNRQKDPKGANHSDVVGYGRIEELLEKAKDLHAVFVATPDHWHCRHTVAALKAGKHVYCEKMMARTVDEGRQMVLASSYKLGLPGKLLQIGHQRRSNPNYRFAYNVLLGHYKGIGRITNANGQWNRGVSQSQDISLSKKLGESLTDEILKASEFFADADGKPFSRIEQLHRFRNWRWFKKYSNGPISDLGAHQIDIFNWVFGRPRSVIAAGGNDYFAAPSVKDVNGAPYKPREWYDNVMCIFDYVGDGIHPGLPKDEVARAYYQVLTTTSSGGGYFENFMGDRGSLKIAENETIIRSYSENDDKSKRSFAALVAKGCLVPNTAAPAPKKSSAVLDKRTSEAPPEFYLTSALTKLPHQPHVENFLRVVRNNPDNDPKKGETLNCDGLHAFQSEAPIFRINEAVEAQKRLFYTEDDFALEPGKKTAAPAAHG
ncbi:MAG: Gfo/Idh/MocA family oxidoreductase [Puniceicoccales bacterium]|jgi:predicted dehydrogenase|nr:Gfo/Idh/MocA family oxidoreductase [Puniceicoccales bacterium]